MISFNTGFGFESTVWTPIQEEGWQLKGSYFTKTGSDGAHVLNFSAELQSSHKLSAGQNDVHYVGLVLAADKALAASEVFACKYGN